MYAVVVAQENPDVAIHAFKPGKDTFMQAQIRKLLQKTFLLSHISLKNMNRAT